MIKIILFILLSLLFVCLFVIVISFRRIENYEKIIQGLDEENFKILEFISSINQKLFSNYENLKEVDRRGSFEADDEVGFVFVTIKEMVQETFLFVNEFMNSLEENVEKEEKK